MNQVQWLVAGVGGLLTLVGLTLLVAGGLFGADVPVTATAVLLLVGPGLALRAIVRSMLGPGL